MLYLLGCYTGFRKSEIGSVTRTSFNFETDPATMTVKAGYSKRRSEDVIPLRGDLAERLQTWLRSKQNVCDNACRAKGRELENRCRVAES
jgi:integrase